jgi:hypothetical protein
MENEEIFWLEKWEGKAKGGLFIRNDLFKFIKEMEKKGIKVVGIKKPDDYNLELIFEDKEENEKK